MKVLFVTPPYHCGVVEVAGTWIPLQFVYLAGAARAAGFDCEIYDAMSLGVGHEEIGKKLDEARADVVCVSSITATYPDALEVARAAKARGATTIVGGVHTTFMWQESLADGGIDYLVLGEGERTLVDLLRCLDTTRRRSPGSRSSATASPGAPTRARGSTRSTACPWPSISSTGRPTPTS